MSGRPLPSTKPASTRGSTAILESDFPEPSCKRAMELARIIHDQDEVDDMTKGFIAADLRIPVADDQIDDWSTELRAGYLARRKGIGPAKWQDEKTRKLAGRINAIWVKWEQMQRG